MFPCTQEPVPGSFDYAMSTSVKPSFEEDEEEGSPVLDLAVLAQGKLMAVENFVFGNLLPVPCSLTLSSDWQGLDKQELPWRNTMVCKSCMLSSRPTTRGV
jgi:hypothetical protein